MSKDDPDRFDKAVMAWHASPHDFDEFGPMRKVSGSGQGAAMYGRGAAYVAENPKISGPGESEYMKEFAHHPAVRGKRATWQTDDGFGNNNWIDLDEADTPFEETHPEELFDPKTGAETWAANWLQYYLANRPDDPQALDRVKEQLQHDDDRHRLHPKSAGTYPNLSAFLNQNSFDFVPEEDIGFDKRHAEAIHNWFKKYGQALDAGLVYRYQPEQSKPQAGPFSYKVAVHLKPETILDWDTILEKHHPEALDKVNQAFGRPEADWASNVQRIFGQVKDHTTYNGRSIYIALQRLHGSDYDASEALFNAGIHGIRYKDEGSRNENSHLELDGQKIVGNLSTDYTKYPEHEHAHRAANQVDNFRVTSQPITSINELVQHLQGRARAEKDPTYKDRFQAAAKWVRTNQSRLTLNKPKPTYNYVIFHPDFVEAMAQYNIKGEKIRDIGPGVHLKTADHDPFKGEDK